MKRAALSTSDPPHTLAARLLCRALPAPAPSNVNYTALLRGWLARGTRPMVVFIFVLAMLLFPIGTFAGVKGRWCEGFASGRLKGRGFASGLGPPGCQPAGMSKLSMMVASSVPADTIIPPGTPFILILRRHPRHHRHRHLRRRRHQQRHPVSKWQLVLLRCAGQPGCEVSQAILFQGASFPDHGPVGVPAWQQHPSPLCPSADDKFAAFLRTIISSVLPSILLSVWQAVVLPLWFYTCAQVRERAITRGGATLPLRGMWQGWLFWAGCA